MATQNSLKYDHAVIEELRKPYSIFAKVYQLIPDGALILDVGCHTGQFGAVLKRKACRVTGVEVDTEAARKAIQVLDHVTVGDVENSSTFQALHDQQYDVILFLDVLEHCRYPADVLSAARKLLKADGFVVASIPNIANWSVRINLLFGKFDYEPTGLMDETHLRFYTIKTVTNLFSGAGYTIDFMDHRYSLPIFRLRKTFGRVLANVLGHCFPGVFSYQMVIKARPFEAGGEQS